MKIFLGGKKGYLQSLDYGYNLTMPNFLYDLLHFTVWRLPQSPLRIYIAQIWEQNYRPNWNPGILCRSLAWLERRLYHLRWVILFQSKYPGGWR